MGLSCWKKISSKLEGKNTFILDRSAKLIKEHYTNHLAPDVRRENWTLEEDLLMIELLNKVGKNWQLIATKMEGRTVTQLKNRYFGRLTRLEKTKKQR